MNNDHNELNDIILNGNEKVDSRKKTLIGIGVLAVVAIVIVIIMGRMSESTPTQLPQPVLPSEQAGVSEESASPDTEKTPETAAAEEHLEAVADIVRAQLEEEPVPIEKSEVVVIDESKDTATPEATVQPESSAPTQSQQNKQAAAVSSSSVPKYTDNTPKASVGNIFIQVGSFSRYKPESKFLDSITQAGYTYSFHRVTTSGKILNKVLVGPFKDRKDAKAHLSEIRRKIEPGAFIYTIK
jgi:DedD protein